MTPIPMCLPHRKYENGRKFAIIITIRYIFIVIVQNGICYVRLSDWVAVECSGQVCLFVRVVCLSVLRVVTACYGVQGE